MTMIIGTIASGISGNLTLPNFSSIATLSGSGTNSVTFSSIPQGYKQLQLRWRARFSTNTSNDGLIYISTNASTSSNNYSVSYGVAGGAQFGSMVTAQGTMQSRQSMSLSDNNTAMYGAGVLDIFNYSNTNAIPTFYSFSSMRNSVNTAPTRAISTNTGAVATVGAITSITIITGYAGNFESNTTFSLYGVK